MSLKFHDVVAQEKAVPNTRKI